MKLVHVTIQTDRFEQEVEFYKNHAGLTIQQDMRPIGRNLVFLADNKGDTCIEIIENKEAEFTANGNISLGFHTDSLTAKRENLISAGFTPTPVISPMPNVHFFFVSDPAGVTVQFI